MAKVVQLRRGTTTEHNTFTGAVGEVTVDTTKDVTVVHDGVTVGGHPVAAKANADGTISLIKKDGTSAGTINATGLFNNTLTSTNQNQALTAAQGKVLNDQAFGVGQTVQYVTGSRDLATTYTNSTGKPIFVVVAGNPSNSPETLSLLINGVAVWEQTIDGEGSTTVVVSGIVPHNSTYSVITNGNNTTISRWVELR